MPKLIPVSCPLNRGGIEDLPLLGTLLAICQKFRQQSFWKVMDFRFINICKFNSFENLFATITSLPELYFRFRNLFEIFGFSAKKLTIRICPKEAKMIRSKFCCFNRIWRKCFVKFANMIWRGSFIDNWGNARTFYLFNTALIP